MTAQTILDQKLDRVVRRHTELRDLLATPDLAGSEVARLSKEYSDLSPVVDAIGALRRTQAEMADAEALAADGGDAEMRALAQAELHALKETLPRLEQEVKLLLLPKDEADARNAILEVRAGTGGEEAALFAADLFRMYQRYASQRGWRFEVMDVSETGLGGFKEATASISGRDVFLRLKFESGVHRVQRVPETEGSGRIHTSAATVAVLPEPDEVQVEIREQDLEWERMRAGGAGGQHVNKTESAVRIWYKRGTPDELEVKCQDERSQHKNYERALRILRSRIYESQQQKLHRERAEQRRTLIGSGDRSERIRTYNFPQSRVTDHRINLTLYKLAEVMEGRGLDELIDALIADDEATRLAEIAA